MKILHLEELAKLEAKVPEQIKESTKTALSKEIIQNNYDLKIASLISRYYLPSVVDYSLKALGIKKSCMYLKQNEYISRVIISAEIKEQKNGFIGEYSSNNFNYLLLTAKNIGSVVFEQDTCGAKGLMGSFKLFDLLKSKALSHLIQAKNPLVYLKNRIFRGRGMSIYEQAENAPGIAPNTTMGYDLGSFTFMPASIDGEEGMLFDHIGHYVKTKEIVSEKTFDEYLSKNSGMKFVMAKGGIFLGPFSMVGVGSVILPGSIIGKYGEVGIGSVVRGYVPPYHKVKPKKNYYCFNKKDLELMLQEEKIEKL